MAIQKKASVSTTSDADIEQKRKEEKKEEVVANVITNATDWFNRLSGDDNIKHAAVTTCMLIRDSVGIVYQDDMWPLIPMIYDAVFEALVDHLVSKRVYHKRYKVSIGKNFVMMYDNIDTGEAEQEGCFMPMMEHSGNTIRFQGHVNQSKKVTYSTIDSMYTENFTNTSDIEHIKATAMQKLQKLYSTDKDGNILEADKCQINMTSNLIMIIFSLFHDALLMRLKMMKEAEPDEDIELNVLGLYRVMIDDVEDPSDANFDGYFVRFEVSDILKLNLKSDGLAQEQMGQKKE